MATHPHDYGRASAVPLSAVLASIPSYPRPVIERLVSRMIEHLDTADGDPDLEDATNAEDEGITWAASIRNYGAGCPVSDPGENEHDAEQEVGELVPHYGIDQTAGAIGWGTIAWAKRA